ncbi:hypothetical protein [Bradyrhizobium sp. CCBAU 11357]|uniref:hypothetical protein n=1 Tax=Bradyrhizobium sp. CCBAU 11357 TaxID=1630808 RepID=UPI002302E365|nr:hypothetical protein [Bradyrhizobium sp. CCBAU 11357]
MIESLEDGEECIVHDEDGYLCVALEVSPGKIEMRRMHELVCASFHGPKPTANSVAIIIDKGFIQPPAMSDG